MLLVKTCNFFLYLFSVKKEHEIKFNHVLNRKETLYTTYFWVNNDIFSLIFFSVKKGVEIKFNDVLDTKQTFFDYKNKNFSKSQKWHPSKGVNPCF